MQQQAVLNANGVVSAPTAASGNSPVPFQPKDTTFTKIFVGGLSYHSTDETLKRYFERFGDIEEAVVITDRQTGKSKGYGFVTMSTKEAANQAVCDPNPVIDGRKANVNLAYLGAKPRVLPSSTGLIPIQITNAYQTLASAAAYGLHPICFQSSPNGGLSGHQFLTTQPTNFVLQAAGGSAPITGAPGSFVDFALQGTAAGGITANPANQAAFYNAAQLSLLEAAAVAALTGRGNGAANAALYAPGSICAANPLAANPGNGQCSQHSGFSSGALPSMAHQVLHQAFALQSTPPAAGAYQAFNNALLASNGLGPSTLMPQQGYPPSANTATNFDRMAM